MLCNILLDKLPSITPNGFKIKTSYKQGVKFELLMQDKEISEEERIELVLRIFYYEDDLEKIETSEELEKRIDDILWFYRCGEEEKTSRTTETNKQKQIYSYEFDSKLIYSAFRKEYNVNLQKEDLHWWEFKGMFESLSDSNKIVEVMGYRAMDTSKIKDKQERKRYRKLQKLYALPDMRSEEEKEYDFAEAFS